MPDSARIDELLDRYQDLLDEGRVPSIDELCQDSPELRPELERRLDRLRRVGDLLGEPIPIPPPDTPLSLSDDKTWVAPSPRPGGVPLEIPAPPGYDVIAPIGEGGMGIVYKARQLGLNRVVALKMILAGTRAQAIDLARFESEARAIAALRHPNIVQVFDIGEFRRQPYFSLEFCAGGTLSKALAGEPQPPTIAAAMTQVLARAIQYAHDRGIVHRDLKPGNVLLSADLHSPAGEQSTIESIAAADHDSKQALKAPESVFKITDFGLAKRIDDDSSRTKDGSVIGTPSYMAPEQAFGNTKEIGPLTDVHAIGAMLYEFLTGRPPFKGSTVHETLEQVRYRDPVRVRELQPKVPRDLETICLKCLEKDSKKRYSSAVALADDLGRFLNGLPIKARPVGQIGRAWRWCRREPRTAGLIGATALLLSLLAAVVGWYSARLGTTEELLVEHQKTMVAAIKAEKAARDEEESQRYFAAMADATRLRMAAQPGWTWEALQRVQAAAASSCPARDTVALRTELAASLAEIDVKPIATFNSFFQPGSIAFLPDGRLVIAPDLMPPLSPFLYMEIVDPSSKEKLDLPLPMPMPVAKNWMNSCTSLAASPDGRWLTLGNRRGDVIVWDLHAKPPKRKEWRAHLEEVSAAVFSSDSKWLITAGHDGQVKRWSITTDGKVDASWPPNAKSTSRITSIVNWPEPQAAVLVQGDGGSRLLDATTLAEIGPTQLAGAGWTAPSFGVTAARLAVHPTSGLVVTSAHSELAGNYWERGICTQLTRFSERGVHDDGAAHIGIIESIALHPTGTLLASACPSEGMAKIWHVPSGGLALAIPSVNIQAVAFSPDGRFLAIGWDHATTVYEISGLKMKTSMFQRGLTVRAMGIAEDGSVATLASRRDPRNGDRKHVVATLWNDSGESIETVIHRANRPTGQGRDCVSINHATKSIAFALSDGTVVWRNSATPQTTSFRERKMLPVDDLSIDDSGGCWTIEAGNNLALRSPIATGDKRTFPVTGMFPGRKGLECVRAGRRFVLVGCATGYLRIVQADDGKLIRSCACFDERAVTALAESGNTLQTAELFPDESQAIAGTDDGRIWLFRLASGDKIASWQGHSDRVTTVTLDATGKWLASGGRDRAVRLWRRIGDRYELYMTLELNRTGPVRQVLFTSDASRLLVLYEKESAVRVWRLDRLHEAFRSAGID